jgi:6-pyruvoyltetrahydropterin/6-carboxytetrahydropterin synthase
MYQLNVESEFSAAHFCRIIPVRANVFHGHNWKIRLTVGAKKVDESGMAMDLADVRELLETCLEPLDHQILNEVAPFDQMTPTSENMARYIYEWIKRNCRRTRA